MSLSRTVLSHTALAQNTQVANMLCIRPSSREQDYELIAKCLSSSLRANVSKALVAEGDCLTLLQLLPDNSISVVLTDPPYHSTKKANIYGDTAFKEDQDYLNWMQLLASEWKRILRPNGSIFCFCASDMAARLEISLSAEFNILSQIVWTKPNDPGFDGWKQKMRKESLRQWYAHTERIVFAEPACEGNLHRSPFAQSLRATRKRTGLSSNKVAELIGAYGRVNHGGAISNWETGRNIPSRQQYAKLCGALFSTGKVDPMPPYEDAVRPFSVNSSKEFTDVWTFPSVRPYRSKHPAEKPVSMLEHAIESTSFEGDIILDCFAGAGSTAVAAANLNRRSVSIEIEPHWTSRIIDRLSKQNFLSQPIVSASKDITSLNKSLKPQLGLFSNYK